MFTPDSRTTMNTSSSPASCRHDGRTNPGARHQADRRPGVAVPADGITHRPDAASPAAPSSAARPAPPARRRRLALAVLGAGALVAAAPAAAQADSISFLRGGNIWVAASDGTRQKQITTTGGYAYQSRADDGSYIALHGRRLRRLTPDGRVLAEFDTPVSGEQTAPYTSFFRGPYKPEITPDGSKVAYEYWHQAYVSQPGCQPVGNPACTDSRISVGVGYSHPDRSTSWDEPGLGRQSGWLDPSWIDDGTLLMSGKSVRPNVDTIIDRPGDGNQAITRWFEDTEAWYLRDGELSRRGDAAAFVSTMKRDWSDPRIGQEDDQITVYRLNGAAPALPEQCFSFQAPERVYSSPSLAPDGGRVAWSSRSRTSPETEIVVGDVPSQAAGCALPTAGGRTLIADAEQPDWSPAPVPATPDDGTPGGGTGGPGTPGGSGGTGTPGDSGGTGKSGGTGGPGGSGDVATRPGTVRITVPAARLGRVLARGLRVTVRVPRAGRVRLVLARSGRMLATASARTTSARTVTLRLRPSARARRTLRSAGRVTLTLRHAFTPAGGTTRNGTVRVTLRR